MHPVLFNFIWLAFNVVLVQVYLRYIINFISLMSEKWTIFNPFRHLWASLVAQTVKNLPAMQETGVWSLGQEDPLEKEMATHSSVLAWRISWTEKPGRLQSMGSQRVRHDWVTNAFMFTFKPHHTCIYSYQLNLTLIMCFLLGLVS